MLTDAILIAVTETSVKSNYEHEIGKNEKWKYVHLTLLIYVQ